MYRFSVSSMCMHGPGSCGQVLFLAAAGLCHILETLTAPLASMNNAVRSARPVSLVALSVTDPIPGTPNWVVQIKQQKISNFAQDPIQHQPQESCT